MKLYKVNESKAWYFGWLSLFAIGWAVIICGITKYWGMAIAFVIGIYLAATAISILAAIGAFLIVLLMPSIDLRKKKE